MMNNCYVFILRKEKLMQYLILGASGYIGNYIYNCMEKDGQKVLGTRYHCKGVENLVNFDVVNDNISDVTKLIMDREKTAIICIAQTNIDQCKVDYELSKLINVVSIKRIIEDLLREKFHVIYFSTDNVFDGIKGDYTELDTTNAINYYGKMKEEIEHFLTENYPEVCIFRLPKVIGTEKEKQNLLTDLESKSKDKEVRCIKGTRISIISNEDVYQSCLISAKRKLCGIYNISNGEIYSRKELAEKFYKYMGIHDKNIVELEVEKFGFKDMRPLNISLDNSKFIRETGYDFISFDTIAERYVKNLIYSNN